MLKLGGIGIGLLSELYESSLFMLLLLWIYFMFRSTGSHSGCAVYCSLDLSEVRDLGFILSNFQKVSHNTKPNEFLKTRKCVSYLRKVFKTEFILMSLSVKKNYSLYKRFLMVKFRVSGLTKNQSDRSYVCSRTRLPDFKQKDTAQFLSHADTQTIFDFFCKCGEAQ